MKEDWTRQLKEKLEGHEMTPPAGLWEGISEQMGLAETPVRQKASFAWLRWAAAAVVLALVGFFAFLALDDEAPQQQVKVASTAQPKTPDVLKTPDIPKVEEALPVEEHLLAQAPSAVKPVQPEVPIVSGAPAEPEITEAAPEPAEAQPASEAEPSPSLQPEQHIASVRPSQPKAEPAPNAKSSSDDSHRWTIGLNASGGLLAANTSAQPTSISYGAIGSDLKGAAFSEAMNYYNNFFMGNTALSGYANSFVQASYVADHHLPLRVGLGVHYQLNSRLALLSGLNYTYLYSKFSMPYYQQAVYEQKLHYLGVPLGIAWQFWSVGNFHFYLSGSAMLEKCLNDKPWQWSLNAAAGAEYNLSRQIGLYLEPSIGYYFDDGTPLEHYYKEHPLAPAIEFGLRLHLKE